MVLILTMVFCRIIYSDVVARTSAITLFLGYNKNPYNEIHFIFYFTRPLRFFFKR